MSCISGRMFEIVERDISSRCSFKQKTGYMAGKRPFLVEMWNTRSNSPRVLHGHYDEV